jgi:hypothetical protein
MSFVGLLLLSVGSVALFVFLARSAEARIVAAYLFAGASGGVAVGVGCGGADGAGLLEFALLFLVELALQSIDGGGRGAVGDRCMLSGCGAVLR